jgi:hypothetical protein
MSKLKLTKQEFEKELTETFPKLYKSMYGDFRKTCMHFGVSIGNGWFDLIWELSEKLEPLIGDNDIRAEQVKEKFGGLRFYINNYQSEAIQDLIQEAEQKSYTICEVCGEKGKRRMGGWIVTLCDKHYEEKQARIKEDNNE